jgi:hypothetical protein
MAFSATVNLGTIGSDIVGQTVSISGCTGVDTLGNCTGCTPMVSAQAVSSFPKTISNIDDTYVSLFVKVDGGPCVGTTQCISITTVDITATPTLTPTITPTFTPNCNFDVTVGFVETTPTPTITMTPTQTITPTIEPLDCLCFCVTYDPVDLPEDLYVRYRNCTTDTTETELISGLESIDNGDGTFTACLCVRQGGLYATPVCVQGGLEIFCPSGISWIMGSSCDGLSSPCLLG